MISIPEQAVDGETIRKCEVLAPVGAGGVKLAG